MSSLSPDAQRSGVLPPPLGLLFRFAFQLYMYARLLSRFLALLSTISSARKRYYIIHDQYQSCIQRRRPHISYHAKTNRTEKPLPSCPLLLYDANQHSIFAVLRSFLRFFVPSTSLSSSYRSIVSHLRYDLGCKLARPRAALSNVLRMHD